MKDLLSPKVSSKILEAQKCGWLAAYFMRKLQAYLRYNHDRNNLKLKRLSSVQYRIQPSN